MSKRKFNRMKPDIRKGEILEVAIALSKTHGYNRVTRDQVADAAGVSMGLVTHRFGTMNQLRRDIMRRAVEGGIVEIIAQGLAMGNPHAEKAPADLKKQAVEYLASR